MVIVSSLPFPKIITPYEIKKAERLTDAVDSSLVSNLAKKALVSIAQLYRAIPCGFFSLLDKVGARRFALIDKSCEKYNDIWTGLKILKHDSARVTWVTKEFFLGALKKSKNENLANEYEKLSKKRSITLGNETFTQNVVVLKGFFKSLAKGFWYSGSNYK
ncbi:MAG: hypothetical protein COT84_00495 [Chlamydiae bacterium CG10_big_fil_rev_8_21_14_0_10_35_9]|nr:MAG: hypothetical protein COT84_00495 [Chlamydiae bacterium CG10_big_fil_rev_8_21_14_0_10_35_9]